MGPDGERWIKDFCSAKVLPTDSAVEAKVESGFRRAYNDPKLKSPKVYAQLVRRLIASGVVDITQHEHDVTEHVGVFTVAKKSGRQRLVVDARASNFSFRAPEHVKLATGSTRAARTLGRPGALPRSSNPAFESRTRI